MFIIYGNIFAYGNAYAYRTYECIWKLAYRMAPQLWRVTMFRTRRTVDHVH